MKNKVRTYFFTCLFLTLFLTLLRSISMSVFYDPQIAYFNSSFVTTLTNVFYIVSTIWCLSSLIFFPKVSLTLSFTPQTPFFQAASLFSGILFPISALFIFLDSGDSSLCITSAAFAILATFFFIFSTFTSKVSETIKAFASIPLAVTATAILADVYFDMTIAMNSPHKLLGSLALVSAEILILCETRTYLGKPLHRIHLASALVTFMLGASFTISNLIYVVASSANLTEFETNPIILGNIGYLGIILGISVYALARAFSFDGGSETQN